MKIRSMVVALTLALPGVLFSAAPASACDPGDPNCNVGCELIEKTPVVNKIVACNT